MSPIPPPPKISPSALALDPDAVAKAVKQAEYDARHEPVPAGFKRVYAPNIPHQGKKERERRRKQLEKLK